MQVHIQFIFRPTNWVTKFLAWCIGAPTWGVIRAGNEMNDYGDGYDTSAVLVSWDHLHAEIMGLASPVTTAHRHGTADACKAFGLKIGWKRAIPGGFVKRGNLP